MFGITVMAAYKIAKFKSNPNNPRIIKDERFRKLCVSLKEFPEITVKRNGKDCKYEF